MSRISLLPVNWTQDISVNVVEGGVLLKRNEHSYFLSIHKSVRVIISESSASLSMIDESLPKKQLGTAVALFRAAIADLTTPKVLTLTCVGVGFKAFLSEGCIIFSIGYSHMIAIAIPSTVSVAIKKDGKIELSGMSQHVSTFASLLRSLRKYNPYKGKGIVLDGIYMRRKESKKKK